jgi:hypothetical protein
MIKIGSPGKLHYVRKLKDGLRKVMEEFPHAPKVTFNNLSKNLKNI